MIWCLVILALLAIVYMIAMKLTVETSLFDMTMTWFLGMLYGSALTVYVTMNHPTAMDVYRGKTTLEITYKDSVAVDSVVVFK